MATCPTCGAEHDLLDPVFRRPDAWVALDEAQRREHARADDDLCRIDLPGAEPRCFVRGTLPVAVHGRADGVHWGVWAEIDAAALRRIVELWNATDVATEPPFQGRLANAIAGYDGTLGLPVTVQLTGPTTRPELRFAAAAQHPFAAQCRAGVDLHTAAAWLAPTAAARGFDRTPHLRAFVCSHVFAATHPILYAVHDHQGDWQLLCGGAHDDGPHIVGLGHLLARDASLHELAELAPGSEAERATPTAVWVIRPLVE